MPGGFDDDAATTASVKSGIPGTSQAGYATTSTNNSGLDTNKALPPAPAGTGIMGSGSNTTAGSGSNTTSADLPDRSVGRYVCRIFGFDHRLTHISAPAMVIETPWVPLTSSGMPL